MLLTDLVTDRALLFTFCVSRAAEDLAVEEGNHLGEQARTLVVVKLVFLNTHHLEYVGADVSEGCFQTDIAALLTHVSS